MLGDVEAALVVGTRHSFETVVALPFAQHLLRCTQRVAPVDDSAATQAGAREHSDAEVVGGQQAAAEQQPRCHLGLVAGEVRLVQVIAHLENYDVRSRRRELGRDHGTASPGTDDDGICGQL